MLWKSQMPSIIGFGASSRTREGNSRKRSESVSGVFPEFFRNFFRKVPAVLGARPKVVSKRRKKKGKVSEGQFGERLRHSPADVNLSSVSTLAICQGREGGELHIREIGSFCPFGVPSPVLWCVFLSNLGETPLKFSA